MNLITQNELTMSSREIDDTPIIKGIGYVYIIENTKTNLVKIGCSTKPKQRVKTIIGASGSKGRVFISHKVKGMFKLENAMHRIFSDKRVTGEWFSVDFNKAKEVLIKKAPKEITMEEINRLLILKDKGAKRIVDYLIMKFKENHNQSFEVKDYYSAISNSLDTSLLMLSASERLIRSTCKSNSYSGLAITSGTITDLILRIIDIQAEIKNIEAIQSNEISYLSEDERDFVKQQLACEIKKIKTQYPDEMVA